MKLKTIDILVRKYNNSAVLEKGLMETTNNVSTPSTGVGTTSFSGDILNMTDPDYAREAFHQEAWVEFDILSLSLVGNGLVALLALLYFYCMRMNDKGYFSHKKIRHPKDTPLDLPGGLVSWVPALLSMSEEDVLRYAGFDAVMLLRVYATALYICAIMSLYGVIVIVPTNITGGQSYSDAATSINSFNQLSMSNIQHYDSRMWVHGVGVYLITGLTCCLLYRDFGEYRTLRHDFLRRKQPHLRTILVEGIPTHLRSNDQLLAYFSALYPGAVSSVYVPHDLSYLRSLINQREDVVGKLELSLMRKNVAGEGQFHKTGFLGCGPKVESIPVFEERLKHLNAVITREQSRYDMGAHAGEGGAGGWGVMAPPRNRLLNDKEKDEIEPPPTRDIWPSLTSELAAVGVGIDSNGAGPIERSILNRGCFNEPNGGGQVQGASPHFGSISGVLKGGSEWLQRFTKRKRSREQQADAPSGPLTDNEVRHLESAPLMGWRDGGNDECNEESSTVAAEAEKKGHHSNDSVAMQMKYGSAASRRGEEEEGAWNNNTVESPSKKVKKKKRRPGWGPFSLLDDDNLAASRAFMTFRTFAAATTAQQVVHCARPYKMAVVPAPEPYDVFWPNIIVSRRTHATRWLVVELVLIFAMIFFPMLVTLLSFELSADHLMQQFTIIREFCEHSKILRAGVELIQPLLLISVMSLLPSLLYWVGTVEGLISYSQNQLAILSRMYAFMVVNALLVTTFAGSIFDVLGQIIDHPSKTFMLLGETLPKMAGFFCNYVIIRAFSGLSLELTRVASLISAWIHVWISRNETVRNHRKRVIYGIRAYTNSGAFPYGRVLAQDLLVLTVCMTYACLAPLILIAGVLFFGMSYIVYKHQILYVYESFETGGSFFPAAFRRFIFALFTAQATMIGMFLLKGGMMQVYAIGALMVGTFYFKFKMREMWEPVAASLPLEIATALDLMPQEPEDKDKSVEATTVYLQPEQRAPAVVEPFIDPPNLLNIPPVM